MKTDYETLFEVSEVDSEVLKLEHAKSDLPVQISGLEIKVKHEEDRFESLKSRIESLEKELAIARDELRDEKSGLENSNGKLNTISTNREYDAVHSEILTHTEQIHKLEDSVSALESQGKEARTELEPLEAAFAELKGELTPHIDKLKGELDSLDERIKGLQDRAAILKEKLPQTVLKYYERLMFSKIKMLHTGKQSGIISVLRGDNTHCSICFTDITRQKLQAIKRGSEIQFCDMCGSIIIAVEDSAESDAGEKKED